MSPLAAVTSTASRNERNDLLKSRRSRRHFGGPAANMIKLDARTRAPDLDQRPRGDAPACPAPRSEPLPHMPGMRPGRCSIGSSRPNPEGLD